MKSNKASLSKIGNRNPNWKGNNVGYCQLHDWVRARFPQTKLCQGCNERPPLDLANKGIYSRDLQNWEWLCRKCHMQKDGRIKNLKPGKSGIANGFYGKHHSVETKNKLSSFFKKHPSRYWLGKKLSKEMIEKSVEAKKRNKQTRWMGVSGSR